MIHRPREHLHYRVHGLRRGDAQAVDEPALNAALRQKLGHLLTAPVDHHYFKTIARRPGDLARETRAQTVLIKQRASQLNQNSQSSPAVSGYPSARFMFWTAWPAAPFPRLSIAVTTTARPVAASNRTPMSQKLVCATDCRSGTCPTSYRRTNGSPA